MVIRNIIVLFVLSMVVACTTANTYVYVAKPISFSDSPTVVLRMKNDTESLTENVTRRIRTLGFRTMSDFTTRPTYYAYAEYTSFWDLGHRTLYHFEIVFVEARSNTLMVKSDYTAQIGLNNYDEALDLLFKDLQQKLK
ncbi:MAG: hypothetical protein PHN75_11940 [Syntrophales bacterium]|nr:hypothetical protein [Syntrophales bacterium]